MKDVARKRPEFAGSAQSRSQECIKLKDLAVYLGLSKSTISRVINGAGNEHRIAPETQKRILQAASLFRYQPNAVARQLCSRRSFSIGIVVPEISEGYAAAVLGGIEESLLREDYFYFVVSHRHHPELLKAYPRLLLSRSVEGIIAVDTQIDEDLPVPIVAVSSHKIRKGVIRITLDHLAAARYARNHLCALGHRKIAFIKGQRFSSDTTTRWNAIRKVCAELDIPIDPQLVVQLEGAARGGEPGYQAAQTLLARRKLFTAVFAFNDIAAISMMSALQEAGLHVPRDVSIVGFDDIPVAATVCPSLTTIHQPLHDMGSAAAVNLLSLIRNGSSVSREQSISVMPSLIERHSTAPCAEKPVSLLP